uniref:Uncharacterized protein n=1 Tax=Trichuris muris TaxID=70415 RepID=A0A5S6QWG3_TRIMR
MFGLSYSSSTSSPRPTQVFISSFFYRGSRRRPQPATVSQSQEPSLVDATFKGRRKKPDTTSRCKLAARASAGAKADMKCK